jgi:hypothetical protein
MSYPRGISCCSPVGASKDAAVRIDLGIDWRLSESHLCMSSEASERLLRASVHCYLAGSAHANAYSMMIRPLPGHVAVTSIANKIVLAVNPGSRYPVLSAAFRWN